jgi:hypothetical protein
VFRSWRQGQALLRSPGLLPRARKLRYRACPPRGGACPFCASHDTNECHEDEGSAWKPGLPQASEKLELEQALGPPHAL